MNLLDVLQKDVALLIAVHPVFYLSLFIHAKTGVIMSKIARMQFI